MPIGLVRFTGVRSAVVIAVFGVGVAHAAPSSNPAFLGITMQDARKFQNSSSDGCMVEAVTPSSGADAAGLRAGDIIRGIDEVIVASCNQLSAEIASHSPGETIKLDVARGPRITISATLSTRAEIIQRRLVGHPYAATTAVDVDDSRAFDLSDLRGETTILAWFDTRQCSGCVSLIRHVGDRLRADKKLKLIAIAPGTPEELGKGHTSVSLGAPLAAVDARTFSASVTDDRDRAFFTVLDTRGHIRFVMPVLPEDEAVDAAIDEVVAAAEQVEHARLRASR